MASFHVGDPPVRWGILGPGDIAARFVASLQRAPGAQCVAVASRALARAQGFAANHAVPRAYGSYAELVNDPEVDVVYVATPQAFHHEHGRLALEHGRGVLIEKPLAMSRDEAADLVSLAESRGLFLMEGLWTLCNPLVRRLISITRSADHGALQAMFSNCGPLAIPADHRALDGSIGGAFYREVLVYPLALWLALTERDATMDVWASARLANGTDYASTATLTTVSGQFMSMAGSFARGVTSSAASRAHLVFDAGWAELDDVFKPSHLRVSYQDRVEIETLGDGPEFEYEIAEAQAAVLAGRVESGSVPHVLSLALAEVLDRIASEIQPDRGTHATH